ncbi:hypothetical protein SAMN05421736_10943 [Evansella caseinilytica]|uniref:Uncharacterized protein n=1 Tax=Evansella caseinilytica TaxID=1503961 RepID=A0A1H3RUF0_9BACI|nr:hypothetical protein [Evansella caseinilytica]SDZ28955.1 hypothetical protein SAMN05421736_10943 [Evansella caseinilytica]
MIGNENMSFLNNLIKCEFKKEDIAAARRSRRGSHEQRSVQGTYVSSGGATQRRDSPALYPGLFEQPHKV